jgi:hypothetical protein
VRRRTLSGSGSLGVRCGKVVASLVYYRLTSSCAATATRHNGPLDAVHDLLHTSSILTVMISMHCQPQTQCILCHGGRSSSDLRDCCTLCMMQCCGLSRRCDSASPAGILRNPQLSSHHSAPKVATRTLSVANHMHRSDEYPPCKMHPLSLLRKRAYMRGRKLPNMMRARTCNHHVARRATAPQMDSHAVYLCRLFMR